MSIKLRRQVNKLVMSSQTLTSPERFVLFILADYASDITHLSFPGTTAIAQISGLSRSTVQRALHGLEAAELIAIQDNRVGGRGKAVVYELRLPAPGEHAQKVVTVTPIPEPEPEEPPVATAPDPAEKVVAAQPFDGKGVTIQPDHDTLYPSKVVALMPNDQKGVSIQPGCDTLSVPMGSTATPIPAKRVSSAGERVSSNKGKGVMVIPQPGNQDPGTDPGYDVGFQATLPGIPKEDLPQPTQVAPPTPRARGAGQDGIAQIKSILKSQGVDIYVNGRDGAKMKQTDAPPELIAEAIVAISHGEWGDQWMRDNLSVWAVVDRINAYKAFRATRVTAQAIAAPTASGKSPPGLPPDFDPESPMWERLDSEADQVHGWISHATGDFYND